MEWCVCVWHVETAKAVVPGLACKWSISAVGHCISCIRASRLPQECNRTFFSMKLALGTPTPPPKAVGI